MKNKIFFLLVIALLCSCCETTGLDGGSSSKVVAYIRQGMGDYGTVVYTYDGHYIRSGMGDYGSVVYTVDWRK